LEQDRVVDSSIRSGPIQEPVTNHELNGFAFAVDPPAKIHGSWTFYFLAPGGFVIEVLA